MAVPKETKDKLVELAIKMWETMQGIEDIAPWDMPRYDDKDYEDKLPSQLIMTIWPNHINFLLPDKRPNRERTFLLNFDVEYDIENEEWKERNHQ